MKQVLVLLSSVLLASASVEVLQPAKVVAEPLADEVAVKTKKVESIVGGLEGILASQEKAKDGPTEFAKTLKPFLAGLHEVLKEVKTAKLTQAQKLQKLSDAQASVKGLTKDMDKMSEGLKDEDDEDQESILMGVLMARSNRPAAEQMEVVKSSEFKNLDVVKFVLAHPNAKKGLAEQVATYLDEHQHHKAANLTKAAAPAAKMSLKDVTQQIAAQLTLQLKKMQEHLSSQDKVHSKIAAEFVKTVKEDEGKASLKGADKAQQRKAQRQLKMAQKMARKEEREHTKNHALTLHDISSVEKAIESVKKGDMKALEAAKDAIQQSLTRMKSTTGDFLHFLQLSAWTESSRDGACPYCKAQCLEKCHNGGQSFMDCMGQCASVGN